MSEDAFEQDQGEIGPDDDVARFLAMIRQAESEPALDWIERTAARRGVYGISVRLAITRRRAEIATERAAWPF